MKTIFLFLTFNLITFTILGQDTIYFDQEHNKLNNSKNAAFYNISQQSENNQFSERTYFISGQIKSELFYIVDKNNEKLRTGKSSFWYENGPLKNEMSFKNGKIDGDLISYWENGQQKRKDFYKNGKIKNGECWDKNGIKVKYYDIEIKASFPGGQKSLIDYLSKNLKYPTLSKQNKIGGKVIIGFNILSNGKIANIKVLSGVNPEIDNEATRLIENMPDWNPAYQDGNAVTIKYRIPLNFNP